MSGGDCGYDDCDDDCDDDERDHSCGCGDCCDACWFDCCASRRGIEVALDQMVDLEMPLTNCGFVPLAQMEFIIEEWTKRA